MRNKLFTLICLVNLIFTKGVLAQNPYPILPIDSIQFVSQVRLSTIGNTLPDYISPNFKNTAYRDTVRFEGIVVTNPMIYGLSPNRKAAYIQRVGGGPWSGVLVMCEPSGTGATLTQLNSETNFYQNFVRGQRVRVTGVIRDFQGETQINLIRNNTNFSNSVEVLPLNNAAVTWNEINIQDLMQGGGSVALSAQKQTAEQWEGTPVIIKNVTVHSSTISGSRTFWTVKDDSDNIIDIRDVSAYYRRDDNEDTIPKVANTFQAPAVGTRLEFIRGIVTEYASSGSQRYGISPQYPNDIKVCDSPCTYINIKTISCALSNSSVNISISKGNISSDTAYLEFSLNPIFSSLVKVDTFNNFIQATTLINTILNVNAGKYYLRLRAKNKNVLSNSIVLNVSPNITTIFNDTSVVFKQDSMLLDAGAGFFNYNWSRGDSTQSIWVKSAGLYKVTVKNSLGCDFADSTTVIFVKGIQQKDTAICSGTKLTLQSADIGLKIRWSTGDTTNSIIISPISDITYNCNFKLGSYSLTDSIKIIVKAAPILSLSDTILVLKQDSVWLDAGLGSNQYRWSTGDTTQGIWTKISGKYKVTVKNTLECISTDSSVLFFIKGIEQKDTAICLGSSIVLNTITSGEPVPKNGLISWWPFNGNPNDESLNGNNGNLYGPVLSTDRNGKPNSAYNFNGVNQYITIPSLSNINNYPITYSIWFTTNALCTNTGNNTLDAKLLIGRDQSVASNFQTGSIGILNASIVLPIPPFTFNVPNRLSFYTGGTSAAVSSQTPSVNAWHNLTFTCDSVKKFKFYFNGVLTDSGNFNGLTQGIALPFKIGSGDNRFFWNGKIDDIGIWNRTLSNQEISHIYYGIPFLNTSPSIRWSTNETSNSININPSKTTTYYCDFSVGSHTIRDSVEVSVWSLPTKLVSYDKLALCKNDTLNLSAAAGYNYNWLRNNISIGQNQMVKVTLPGNYMVKLTDANGCTSSSDTIRIYSAPLPNIRILIDDTAQCLNENNFKFKDSTTLDSGTYSRLWELGGGNVSTQPNPSLSYLAIGAYQIKLKITTNNGCKDSLFKNIVVNPNSSAGIILGDSINVKTATPYIYTATQQMNHTYHWAVSNGILASGQGTNAATVQWISNGTGVVTLAVTNSQGCSDTTTKQVSIGTVGFENFEELKDLIVYPNPSNGLITLEINMPNQQPIKMYLMNMLGQEVWSKTEHLNAGHNTLPLNLNVGPGIYQILISIQQRKYMQTIVIKK